MYLYKIKMRGSIAHHLENYKGDCSRVHGHTLEIVSTFDFPGVKEPENMAVDFKELKALLKEIIPDHLDLNEKYQCANPTAEFLAKVIFKQLEKAIEKKFPNLTVRAITVWESSDASCTYGE